MICDTCAYCYYDEEDEEYYCSMDLDEDDAVRFYSSPGGTCPYYRLDDEYAVVKHQAF